MLIGINGKAGSGKDTVGDHLIKQHGFKQIALADPIKRLVKDVFALDDHTVYDREAREQPLPQWNNWSVRKLLQFIGTELFRDKIDNEIWVKSLWFRIRDHIDDDNYVVTDVRFPNEMEFFQKAAGDRFAMFKVVREGHGGNVGLKGHRSESFDLDADFEIQNDGTIEDLYNKVDAILQDDLGGRL